MQDESWWYNSFTEFTYNVKGLVSERKVTSRHPVTGETSSYSQGYKYDEVGQLKVLITGHDEVRYSYNDEGALTKFELFDLDGDFILSHEYFYEEKIWNPFNFMEYGSIIGVGIIPYSGVYLTTGFETINNSSNKPISIGEFNYEMDNENYPTRIEMTITNKDTDGQIKNITTIEYE